MMRYLFAIILLMLVVGVPLTGCTSTENPDQENPDAGYNNENNQQQENQNIPSPPGLPVE